MKKLLYFLPVSLLLTGCGNNVVPAVSDSSAILTTIAESNPEFTKMTVKSGVSSGKVSQTTTKEVQAVKITNEVEPPENFSLTALESLEVYQRITVADFVTDSNVEILNGSELVDTSETGQFEADIVCGYNDGQFEYKVSYTVEDTTPPLVLNNGWSPYVTLGSEFNLSDLVGYADNYDRHPQLTYTGSVDTSEVGNYPISVSVTDSSGNVSSWDMDVLVLNEIPESSIDNGDPMSFADFKEKYSGENRKFGIDVSTWQGDIDFNAVKNAGCDFVIIRMGYYYDHVVTDDYYFSNIEKATDAGLDVGVYFYTTDTTPEGVREHVKWIADNLENRKLDFPVAFDWEEFTNFQEFGINLNDLNNLFEIFCTELENYGYSGMLYSSKNFLVNSWTNYNNRPVWLAHFVEDTDYTGRYFMWQESCTGHIDGINGDVDMNILYTDR